MSATQASAAITRKHSKVLCVESLVGIPDYESMLDKMGFNAGSAEGLMNAQEFRLSTDADTGKVQLHYRDDCTVDGWLPRPVLPTTTLASTWKDFFKCSDPTQGIPVSFTHHPLTGERGRRQWWSYDVKFAGGASQEFELPCPSIPIQLDREELVEELAKLQRQTFSEKGFKQLETGKQNVRRLLEMKGYWPSYGFIWDQFFADLPQDDNDSRYPKLVSKSALKELAENYKGDVQVTIDCYLS